jgi:lipoyl(octanoyl) transferase
MTRYAEALALQRSIVAAKKAGDAGDYLIFVEHPPVVTLGRKADEKNLVVPREALAKRGIDVVDIERGGDVTYHGPGQLVGYPIIDLKARRLGLTEYLRLLEGALIEALAGFGIEAGRRKGLTGVWSSAGKLAAIGVAVTRWITFHGFALNVTTDVSAFDVIVPCGLAGERVASMKGILGREVEMDAVKRAVAAEMGKALGAEVVPGDRRRFL